MRVSGRIARENDGRFSSWKRDRHHVLPRGPCRHSVDSARSAHPGCSIGRPRRAGLLACGSSPRITFPDSHPVVFDAWHTAYSCGGSPGFYPSSRFNPLEGELVTRGKVPERSGRVNWAEVEGRYVSGAENGNGRRFDRRLQWRHTCRALRCPRGRRGRRVKREVR